MYELFKTLFILSLFGSCLTVLLFILKPITAKRLSAKWQYAAWIAEELGCRAVSIDEFKKNELKNYDNVIYGGGVQAGGIKELDKFMKWIKSDLKLLDMYRSGKITAEDLEKSGVIDRHYAIFAVGINLDDMEARQQLRDINFPKSYMKQLPCFFLPGEYHPENLKGADKMIMNLAQKMIKGKRE